MKNLLVYMPTINSRHLEWFRKYPGSNLFLISQHDAERLISRLSRNIVAIPTEMMKRIIESEKLVHRVDVFDTSLNSVSPFHNQRVIGSDWVVADEDISRIVAEQYLVPTGFNVSFEMIWARYDMTTVKAKQGVIADAKLSSTTFDRGFMAKAVEVSKRSPDWWRQVGAVLLGRNQQFVVGAYNTHFPDEYETYVFGDPGINRDAGEPGIYTVLHAERAVIAYCARHGIAMAGSDLFVTTFPCVGCSQEIIAAGVRRVFFLDGYSELNALDNFRTHKIQVIQVVPVPEQAVR